MSSEEKKISPEYKEAAGSSLQNSELLFRQFGENSSDILWMSSLTEDKVLYVSPHFEKIWGISLASLHYSRAEWLTTVYPEDREKAEKYYGINTHCVAPNGEIEYRIRRPDSSVRWINDQAFIVNNEQGNPYRIGGISRDITSSKMSELRRDIRHEIALAFEKYNQLEELAPKISQIFCEWLGWKIGIFWSVDPNINTARFFFLMVPRRQVFGGLCKKLPPYGI